YLINSVIEVIRVSPDRKNERQRFDLDMSPFRDLMEQMDSFFNQSFKQMDSFFKFRPFRVHVDENESEIIVHAELPGIEREQIKLEIINNHLRIAAEKTAQLEAIHDVTKDKTKEQSFQRAERWVTLPYPVPKEDITATYNDNVLQIILPKQNKQRNVIDIDESN